MNATTTRHLRGPMEGDWVEKPSQSRRVPRHPDCGPATLRIKPRSHRRPRNAASWDAAVRA